MRILFTVCLFTLIGGPALQARVDLLLVPPSAPVPAQAGMELTLYLNNPTELDEVTHFPSDIVAHYASATGHGRVSVTLANPQDSVRPVPAMTRQTIVLRLDEPIPGGGNFVSLRLTNPASNAIMIELAPGLSPVDSRAARAPAAAPTPARPPWSAGRNIDVTTDVENMRRHISAYDPIYFAVGWRERFTARFQFSFKYRVFERGPPGEPWLQQLARDLYVAYTQTSIWDLDAFSRPFYDSTYKPTAFLLHEFDRDKASRWHYALQAGAQHESNGKGGSSVSLLLPTNPRATRHLSDSRSFNTLYLAPTVRWTGDQDYFLEARLQASSFFKTDENPDIERYRGHVELTLRTGYDRGFQFSTHARGKIDGHGSIELNMTWPAIQTPLLKYILPPSLGGYAQVQYFNGYGESLLDYDVRRKDQLRFGMTLVR